MHTPVRSVSEKPENHHSVGESSLDVDLWMNNPSILLLHWDELFPRKSMSPHRNSNALARLILAVTVTRVIIIGDVSKGLFQCFTALMLSSLVSFQHETSETQKHTPNVKDDDDSVVPYANGFDVVTGLTNDGSGHEITVSSGDRDRMAVGVRGALGRATVRASDESRIFSTRPPIHDSAEDEDAVITDNTVGVGKFVSTFT